MKTPKVADIVHYVSYGTPGGEYTSQCRAAVVTAVHESGGNYPPLSLCVINPEGLFFNKEVRFSGDIKGGTWHWPERVEE